MKQKASSNSGVIRLRPASTVSVLAPTSAIDSEITLTMRRSYMSAMAPAGIEINMIGSISAVCTSATLSAEAAICVIAQAAPTPWIRRPRLESRLASQMRRNNVYRRAVMPSPANVRRFVCSVISPSISGVRTGFSDSDRITDACESPSLSSG